MKYSSRLFFSICFFTSLNLSAKDKLHLHGKIANADYDSISISFNKEPLVYRLEKHASKLNTDGTFDMSVRLPQGFTSIDITCGGESTTIIAQPGYDLAMFVDAKHFDSSLQYTGNGSTVANFLALHIKERGGLMKNLYTIQLAYLKTPEGFDSSLSVVLKEENNFLEKNKKGLPKEFVAYRKATYQYLYYISMLDYPNMHEIRKTNSYNVKNIPKENYALLYKVPEAFDDKLLRQDYYKLYLEKYYYTLLKSRGIVNVPENAALAYVGDDSMLKFIYTHMPPASAEYAAAYRLYRGMKYNSVERSEMELKMLKEHFPKSTYLPEINKGFEMIRKTSPGSPAMDFPITTLDGKTLKLSDLKGKVVYLDFWASWCGPCIAQMPSARKLEEKYKDKDVVFLYVSIDEKEENWKKGIEMHKIEGMHMRDKGGFNEGVAKLYEVQGVPTYYLIDKNGNFGMRNPPRPSDIEKLSAAIDALLK